MKELQKIITELVNSSTVATKIKKQIKKIEESLNEQFNKN
jgi:hypothetical protein